MTTRGNRFSSLPSVSVGLWQADMCENATGKFMRHLVERRRTEIVRGYERKHSRTRVGGPIHVANVDFVERGFTHTQHQRAFFFEADVSRTLNQVRCNPVRNSLH